MSRFPTPSDQPETTFIGRRPASGSKLVEHLAALGLVFLFRDQAAVAQALEGAQAVFLFFEECGVARRRGGGGHTAAAAAAGATGAAAAAGGDGVAARGAAGTAGAEPSALRRRSRRSPRRRLPAAPPPARPRRHQMARLRRAGGGGCGSRRHRRRRKRRRHQRLHALRAWRGRRLRQPPAPLRCSAAAEGSGHGLRARARTRNRPWPLAPVLRGGSAAAAASGRHHPVVLAVEPGEPRARGELQRLLARVRAQQVHHRRRRCRRSCGGPWSVPVRRHRAAPRPAGSGRAPPRCRRRTS